MRAHGDEFELAQVVEQCRGVAPAFGKGVAFAQQHDVAVTQQLHALRVLHRGQKAEGEVDAAAVEQGGDLLARHGQGFEPHAGRLLAQRKHKVGQKTALPDVAHVDAEHLARMQRVEQRGFVERFFERAQGAAHGVGQAVGLGGGLHATAGAHEERVLDQQAQPRERLAGRRLSQVHELGRAADAARAVDRVEQAQQVEVNVFDMHWANTA